MNPFLVGYICMLGIFMTHAIARASYVIGKERAKEVIVEKRIKVYEKVGVGYNKLIRCRPEMTSEVIIEDVNMEEYLQVFGIPNRYMCKDEQDYWETEVRLNAEHTIFEGIKNFIKFEEIEDERGEPPFRYKTFRSSIFVGKKK